MKGTPNYSILYRSRIDHSGSILTTTQNGQGWVGVQGILGIVLTCGAAALTAIRTTPFRDDFMCMSICWEENEAVIGVRSITINDAEAFLIIIDHTYMRLSPRLTRSKRAHGSWYNTQMTTMTKGLGGKRWQKSGKKSSGSEG